MFTAQSAESPSNPPPANDEGFPPLSRAWNRVKEAAPRPRYLFVIGTGAFANIMFVTLGLHGAFGVQPIIALAISAWLILMQGILFEACRRNGLLLNAAGVGFYGLFVLFNVVLAAGGITAYFGADTLGRTAFRHNVAAPLAAIHDVTNSTSDFAAAMSSVASYSAEQHRLEVDRGGTCTASVSGSGPISRLRADDAAMFETARRTMDELSTRGRQISVSIDTQIANYSVARHQQVVEAITRAVVQSQQLARDPRLREARRSLQLRAEQIANGRPDRLTPSLLISCPRDTMLRDTIARALAIPPPSVPSDFEVPPVPSEATSVRGLFTALAALAVSAKETDLGPWLASLLLAPLPDALFIFGLTLHRRERRARRTLNEEIATGFGIPAGGLEAAIERALEDPRMKELYSSHILEHGWLFATDWLAVPITADARRRLMLRVVRHGKAFDGGLSKGSELPNGGEGFDPESSYHLFALKPGVWTRLEAETFRSALASGGPNRPHPSSGSGADDLRDEAA